MYGNEESDGGQSGLKPGHFRARAIEAALGESSEGNPQVAVCFEILDEAFAGSQITWYGSFSKNLGKGKKTPLQRTIESLRVCGWDSDDLSDLATCKNNEVSLVLDYEEFKGEKQLKVKWVNRPGGLALKAPMSEAQAKAFAARMKGEVIAASRGVATVASKKPAQNGGHPNAPGGSTGAPGISDDDIPF
jgi:hypothetical protein